MTETDKLQLYASELTIANIIGSWNEQSTSDKIIIGQLTNEKYGNWIPKIREILHQPDSPISLKDGRWSITDRKALWQVLSARLFDDNLDNFKECVVTVLTERDPVFDLPPENRFASSIHGKVLSHSKYLRKGLSDSLAFIGSYPDAFTNCSVNKAKTIAVLVVRDIFENADWILWGSLNDLLPLIAESDPNEFIKAVERALQQTPCPFDELFSQEGKGVSSRNYLTGLLWALETLAWDEQLLVRISAILGELASHDPGGNWANRPINSLTTIFLPWLPQTTASINKRKTAVTTIQRDIPEVAWKLLLNLLPKQHQTSSGSRKPIWREIIPEDWSNEVSKNEYWEQVSLYADLAVDMAIYDIDRLKELIGYFDNLPEPSFEKILKHLSSGNISARIESERLGIWTELTEYASRHRKYANAKWALSPKIVSRIENIAKSLAPSNPLNLHRRLFSGRSFDLFEEKGNWQEQYQQLEEKRQAAIKEILDYNGIDAVIQFVESVESPSDIGNSLGHIVESSIDTSLLPNLLDTKRNKLAQLIEGYVRGRYYIKGWSWVDFIDKSLWSTEQIGQFLAYLPFTEETWKRVKEILNDSENKYWHIAKVNPSQADCDLNLAIDKLIEYGRPTQAIRCFYQIMHDKQPLDITRAVKSLLLAASSNETRDSMDIYRIVEIIKYLQDNDDTNPDDLFNVEWVYLQILNRHHDARPNTLEKKLVSDPDFFCEVIRLVYRSTKEIISNKELSEQEKNIAINASTLLQGWETPPGIENGKGFSVPRFKKWLESIKKECTESGHLEVALEHVGKVLIYTPPDSDGLWINRTVAEELNKIDAEEMRKGYSMGKYNSRGPHVVDPTGKTEKKTANEFRSLAEEVDNAGYPRFAGTLRSLADSYDLETDQMIRIMNEHKEGTSNDP